jgi:regulator of sirC expression with transglutaminase-like and TPR domain
MKLKLFSLLFIFLGDILIKEKKYKEALECYNKMIQIEPKDTYPWRKKGIFDA